MESAWVEGLTEQIRQLVIEHGKQSFADHVRAWAKAFTKALERNLEWSRRWRHHRDRVIHEIRLRDRHAEPPEEGWVWDEMDMSRVWDKELYDLKTRKPVESVPWRERMSLFGCASDLKTKTVSFHARRVELDFHPMVPFSCWLPPELLKTAEPESPQDPIPDPGRPRDLNEQFTALSVIYDATYLDIDPIYPWPRAESIVHDDYQGLIYHEWCYYERQIEAVREWREREDLFRKQRVSLNVALDAVRGELVKSPIPPPDVADKTNVNAPWSPPAGYVGSKTIEHDERFRKNGKNPPRTTLQLWQNRSRDLKMVQDPASNENYYPEEWVREQIKLWHPRRT